MEFLSKSIEETAQIATSFCKEIKPKSDGATVVGLYGELGSGKTTFMKSFAKSLGVEETIQSPTFVIMKRYKLKGASKKAQEKELSNFQTLIHIDAYRLDLGQDLIKLGWQEIISDSKNLICIEWPERVTDILFFHTKIYFKHISENERMIKIE